MIQLAAAQPQLSTLRPPKVAPGILQRACACGGTPGPSGECEECRKKRLGAIQRKAAGTGRVPTVGRGVQDTLRSPGVPLDPATRAFMEPRFGHDFSRVRVHTDATAAASVRQVEALAYTVGQEVVFDAGQYAPGTAAGRRLLAHELAHVVQQKGQPVPGPLEIAPADSPTEREAEELTGLQAGGISPLALIHKGFQVVIDASAQSQAEVHISGGQRGLNIKLAVADLAKLTNARFAPVGRPDLNE